MLRDAIASFMAILLAITSLSAQTVEVEATDANVIEYTYTPIDQSQTPNLGRGSGRSVFDPIPVGKNGYISILLTPAYTTETNLALGVVANYWQYQQLTTDIPKYKLCDISLSAIASISGYYSIALTGYNTISKHSDHKIIYKLGLSSAPSRIWGITFDDASRDNYYKYTANEYFAWAGYDYKSILNIYTDYRYIDVVKLDAGATQILNSEPHNISTMGFGAKFTHKSRNIRNNDYSLAGIHTSIEAIYRPKVLSNLDNNLWSVSALFDYYQPLWKGMTLALDLYGEIGSEATPWLLSAQLGSENRMRSYYTGRYRGNTQISAQLELRQYFQNGIGVVTWGGAGTVFSAKDKFEWRKVLPTYGIGLRYRIDQTIFRFDIGFGYNGTTFLLGLNEAF